MLTGEVTGKPKAHDGAVEAFQLLKMVHRSAHKARAQALLQILDLVTTARTSCVTSCAHYQDGVASSVATQVPQSQRVNVVFVYQLCQSIGARAGRPGCRWHQSASGREPAVVGYFVKRKNASCVVPSTSVKESFRQLPAQPFCVFQT